MSKLDFSSLDIPAEVERHTSTRLHPTSRSGKQFSGACPYDDCSVDENGFTVWRELTDRGRHYYCRGCRRSGDIVKLLRDIRGYSFRQACEALGIANPYEQSASTSTASTPAPAKARGPLAPSDWQVKERDILQGIYPNARRALQRPRARAYLAERGIPYDLAQALGLGYIPPFADIPADKVTDELRAIRPWCDRIIFPLTSPAGQGFTGRSLFLWEEGMDENEHKTQIDAYNARMVQEHGEKDAPRYKVSRWKTTYPAGYFHAEVLESNDDVIFLEGAFDALALIAGSILNVVATCGTSLDALAIPLHLKSATLAYDGDESGRKAATAIRKLLRREVGILDPRICTSPDDGQGKDWSERYRLHGVEGLAPLLDSADQVQCSSTPALSLDTCHECGAPTWVITDENKAYCKACWRKLGHEPAPDEACCLCGDFIDCLDEELLERTGELRFYCDTCWVKRDSQVNNDSAMAAPFASYEHFVSTVEVMAARLTQDTGVPWTVTPLPPGQTIQDYYAQQAEAERHAAQEERLRLAQVRMERTRKRAS
jgi:Toprim-like/CHC2 zinc finger